MTGKAPVIFMMICAVGTLDLVPLFVSPVFWLPLVILVLEYSGSCYLLWFHRIWSLITGGYVS